MKNIINLDTYEVVAITNDELKLIDGGWLGTLVGIAVCYTACACKLLSEGMAGSVFK